MESTLTFGLQLQITSYVSHHGTDTRVDRSTVTTHQCDSTSDTRSNTDSNT